MNSSLQTETTKRSGTKTNKCISLIALGNPEPGYKNTRHNAGRLIVNNMVNQLTSSNGVVPSFDNKTIEYNNNKSSFVFAYVDRTAMNLNGPRAIGFLKNLPTIIEKNVQDVDLSEIKFKNFIIADDKDVKFGATQLRAMDSSNRGHNGYHSCEKAAHKDKEIKYNKVSIGVGKPPVDESQIYDKMILADYVLDYFKPEEVEYLKNETTEKVWDFLLKERN
ncbi:peptidyl-tRNA hydrolase [Hanseniaspora valbyensis NRRL Y-1626]|uniref:peptidyl-tRNA hydrolase n=1 Tax=Hanseniaspora valbyensis NRRL Y-1626 TaxID=766949 RepID=A0A1B7TGX5_9ASCO|nr:peptidyl-tRNA hydrolase [Hanseniaspora valbyensis NRRL Y-1626]